MLGLRCHLTVDMSLVHPIQMELAVVEIDEDVISHCRAMKRTRALSLIGLTLTENKTGLQISFSGYGKLCKTTWEHVRVRFAPNEPCFVLADIVYQTSSLELSSEQVLIGWTPNSGNAEVFLE